MAQRLTERFAVGDQVEITFGTNQGAARWWPGRLVRHDPPGVWVQTNDGRFWFVTNPRRIRLLDDDSQHRSEAAGA